MAYGYRDIGGECVNCLTWDEAIELANTYSRVGGFRYKVQGEWIQHNRLINVSKFHIYCWTVTGLGEQRVGNQGIERKARSNGRPTKPTT